MSFACFIDFIKDGSFPVMSFTALTSGTTRIPPLLFLRLLHRRRLFAPPPTLRFDTVFRTLMKRGILSLLYFVVP